MMGRDEWGPERRAQALALLSHDTLAKVAAEAIERALELSASLHDTREVIAVTRAAIGGNHVGSNQDDYDLDRSLAPLWAVLPTDELGNGGSGVHP